MKIIAALVVLALFTSTNAFMVFPRSGKMSDLRDAFYGFVEGMGASHDGITIKESCFGDATKENLAAVLDEVTGLQMTSRISDLLPVFEKVHILFSDLFENCEMANALYHILAHSKLQSIENFAMNLMTETHHLQHLAMEFFFMEETDFAKVGRIVGEAIGVVLSLHGAEKVPHN